MADTTLARSLSDRIESMRVRRADAVAARAASPAAATRSVLVEVLLEDLAATMPAPLAARVRAGKSPGTAVDWLAAGAVYRAVAHDRYLAGQFLKLVDDNPRAAGVALAWALASKHEPPPRDAAWHRRDRLGLVLQFLAAALVLVARLALFVKLASSIRPAATSLRGADILPSLYGLRLCEIGQGGGLVSMVWLPIALVWAGLEVAYSPQLLEQLRRLPARLRGQPPPLPWRADAFLVVWSAQAVLVYFIVLTALCRALAALSFDQLTLAFH